MKISLKIFKLKEVIVSSIIFFVILVAISVGYAFYNQELDIDTSVVLNKVGMVEIIDTVVTKEDNIINGNYIISHKFTNNGSTINFNINANESVADSGELIYHVKFKNTSQSTYTFSNLAYANNTTLMAPRMTGLIKGEVFEPGEEVEADIIIFTEDRIIAPAPLEYNITFGFVNGNQTISGNPLAISFPNGNEYTYNKNNIELAVKNTNIEDVSLKYTVSINNQNFTLGNQNLENILNADEAEDETFIIIPNDNIAPGEYYVSLRYSFEDGRTQDSDPVKIIIPGGVSLLPGVKADLTVTKLWDNQNYYFDILFTNISSNNYHTFTFKIKFNKPITILNCWSLYENHYDAATGILTVTNRNQYNNGLYNDLNSNSSVDFFLEEGTHKIMLVAPEGLTSDDVEIIYMSDQIEAVS